MLGLGPFALLAAPMISKRVQQRADIPRRHGLAVIETLTEFAADGAQIACIGLVLDALGHDFLAEFMRKRHHRAKYERRLVVDRTVMHE